MNCSIDPIWLGIALTGLGSVIAGTILWFITTLGELGGGEKS